jgi:quercetin dioxygenase-like cupin family protein
LFAGSPRRGVWLAKETLCGDAWGFKIWHNWYIEWQRRRIMARRGETIENALSGERMTFLETTRDTNSRFFEFEFVAPPGRTVAGHVHPRQEERTEMLSGTLDGVVAEEGFTLSPSEFRVVPPGVAHSWQNPGDEGARFSVRFSPALNMESGFETT